MGFETLFTGFASGLQGSGNWSHKRSLLRHGKYLIEECKISLACKGNSVMIDLSLASFQPPGTFGINNVSSKRENSDT